MDETGKKRLWQDYHRLKSPELREKLIIEYAPLVKLVAGRLSMYLGYNVEYDDLVGYGVFGLIDAILDQIRKMDWIPRTIRQRQKKIETVMKEIETTKGRAASDEEIASALGISEDEYTDWQSQMKITGVVSLNEYIEQGGPELAADKSRSAGFEMPEEVVEQVELKEKLKESLEVLTEKERKDTICAEPAK